MSESDKRDRPCDRFGDLDTVFPAGDGGIRTTPPECMRCSQVKVCIQTAMQGPKGLKLQEERVDRAYKYGLIGAVERWSRKKLIRKELEVMTSKARSKKRARRKKE